VLALLKKIALNASILYVAWCAYRIDGLCKFGQNYFMADFWQYFAVFTATWLGLRIPGDAGRGLN
jgi:hypothetical protein